MEKVNRIANLYGKDNAIGYVEKQINSGNLLYADIKKAPTWFTSRGLQLPKLVQTIVDAKKNVAQNSEVVNT